MKKLFKKCFEFLRDYSFGLIVVGLIIWYLMGSKWGPQLMGQNFMNQTSSSNYGYAGGEMAILPSSPMTKSLSFRGNDKIMMQSDEGFSGNLNQARKQIKNGSLILEVEMPEEARILVEQEVENLDGFITSLNSWSVRPKVLAYRMQIKVPAESLEVLIKNLTNIGIKKSENFSVSDITAPYEDTENKLSSLRSRRDRLRKMMEEKTEDLSNVLEIDRELARVQTEIEVLSSTQKRRDTNIAYATLGLTLQPAPIVQEFQSSEWDIQKTWKNAINSFIVDARKILDELVKIAVYLPIWLPALLIIWLIKRLLFGKSKK